MPSKVLFLYIVAVCCIMLPNYHRKLSIIHNPPPLPTCASYYYFHFFLSSLFSLDLYSFFLFSHTDSQSPSPPPSFHSNHFTYLSPSLSILSVPKKTKKRFCLLKSRNPKMNC
eukprot:m.49667 g.49667  ORF g.49667 m.49667 type:complete len:113 (-) comp7464_c1_seq1:33-371(-)